MSKVWQVMSRPGVCGGKPPPGAVPATMPSSQRQVMACAVPEEPCEVRKVSGALKVLTSHVPGLMPTWGGMPPFNGSNMSGWPVAMVYVVRNCMFCVYSVGPGPRLMLWAQVEIWVGGGGAPVQKTEVAVGPGVKVGGSSQQVTVRLMVRV